jgi:tetratricopeptide (TPR) repeat protein
MERVPIKFPLNHPDKIVRHAEADFNTENLMFLTRPAQKIEPNPKGSLDTRCKICSSRSKFLRNAKMLNLYSVDYFECEECGFIQTEKPFWLKEAYADAITNSDTGLVRRNIELSKMCTVIILDQFNKNGKFVDYGGGYGLFVRLMRDYGFNYFWFDEHCENLFAKTFEIDVKVESPYDLVTAFELFEHLVDPIPEIEKMLKLSRNILFSTELIPATNPKPGEWWYYGLEHGQHVSFYTLKALGTIAKKYNLNYYTNGTSLHLFSDKCLVTPLEFSSTDWKKLSIPEIGWFGPHRMERIYGEGASSTLGAGQHDNLESKIYFARIALQEGKLEEAELLYTGLLKLNAQNHHLFHDLGVIAYQRKKCELAADYFIKALALKPDFSTAHNNLGVVFNLLGRQEEAKVCYQMAIVFKSDYAEAYYNRGIVFRDQKKLREAVSDFRKALDLKPDYIDAEKQLELLMIDDSSQMPLETNSVTVHTLIRKEARKMAFVDLAFHQRTKSTLELMDLFKPHFQVDVYWDSGNLDFQKMANQKYDTVLFFQKMYGVRKLKTLDARNIVFIPMYDDVMGISDSYWKQFSQVKFINFSKTLHDKHCLLGLDSKYVQYYISPSSLPGGGATWNDLSGFFWQRTNHIRWSTIKNLIQVGQFDKFHLHCTVDPTHTFEKPSDEDLKKYRITMSDWFPGKEEYLSHVNNARIFFAPRLYEGIGMSFLEAMAMGKCVVAPNLPTMNEYIADGQNGLLYDPKNPVPLDFSQSEKLGKMARISAQEGHLKWQSMVKDLIDFVSEPTNRPVH